MPDYTGDLLRLARENITYRGLDNGLIKQPNTPVAIAELSDFIVNGNIKETSTLRLGKYISKIYQWHDITNSRLLDINPILHDVNQKSEIEQANDCIELIWDIIGLMRAKGYSTALIDEMFEEVNRSNYSKLAEFNGELVCNLDENGVLIVPDTFSESNLQPIIEKYSK